MKNKILAVGFLFISLNGFAQYNWQALPNAPKSWREDDMYFLTPQIGWVIHPYYDYNFPNQYGQVYKTWDGGNTWTLMHDSSGTFYRSVGFIDSLHGWVGNLADTTQFTSGVRLTQDTIPLYYTSDGGRTLTPVNFGFPHPAGICGISVVNDSAVYAYGRYFGPPRLAKTTDRGATWTTTDLSAYATGLVDGKFFNEDTGFITGCNGNNGVILFTTDGGNTFQTKYLGTRNDSEIVWKIFFPSRDTGYASIEYTGNGYYNGDTNYRTYFVSTTDGGNTWTEKPFIDGYDEEGIGFINDSTGWIGGSYRSPNYKTNNGGNTWEIDSTFGVLTPPYQNSVLTAFDINRFRRFGDTLMYASGNTVYRYSSIPLLGINNLKQKQPSTFLFPNPGNGLFILSLSNSAINCSVAIYNALGQQVYSAPTLLPQSGGGVSFSCKIDLSAEPNGIYLYRVLSNSGELIGEGKIVIQK